MKGKLALLEEVKGDEKFLEVLSQRLIGGECPQAIARDLGLPVGRFMSWMGEPKMLDLWDAALKVRARSILHEALEAADNDQGEVVRDKLRVETRLKLAPLWNREQYGTKPVESVSLENLGAVLERISERRREKLKAAQGDTRALPERDITQEASQV